MGGGRDLGFRVLCRVSGLTDFKAGFGLHGCGFVERIPGANNSAAAERTCNFLCSRGRQGGTGLTYVR